jgi:hypothetical protein
VLLDVLTRFAAGDYRCHLNLEPYHNGTEAQIIQVFNSIADSTQQIGSEFKRVSFAVGKEGDFSQRANIVGPQHFQNTIDAFNGIFCKILT